jgi:hypothetical protein
MKYVHWIAYPILAAVILFLTYAVVDQAVWLDDMKQGSKTNRETIDALLRFISVDSPCDKSPQQLAAAMGKVDLVDDRGVSHGAFFAKYQGSQLVRVEDINHGGVAVCTDRRP